MLLFELIEAVWDTVIGENNHYYRKKDDDIYEPRVLDPDDIRRIHESDESITYSTGGDPGQRIREWEDEERREKKVNDEDDVYEEEFETCCEGINPADRIESWERAKEYENRERAEIVSDSEPSDLGDSEPSGYWESACVEAAERMSGDCDFDIEEGGDTG